MKIKELLELINQHPSLVDIEFAYEVRDINGEYYNYIYLSDVDVPDAGELDEDRTQTSILSLEKN